MRARMAFLLGAGQQRDRLGQFGAGGQRPVRVGAGAQEVGEHGGVAVAGFAAGGLAEHPSVAAPSAHGDQLHTSSGAVPGPECRAGWSRLDQLRERGAQGGGA